MGKAKILVVEDEPVVAMDIKASLEDMGYSVTSLAASGTQAIEEAELLCGQIRALIDAVDEVNRHTLQQVWDSAKVVHLLSSVVPRWCHHLVSPLFMR